MSVDEKAKKSDNHTYLNKDDGKKLLHIHSPSFIFEYNKIQRKVNPDFLKKIWERDGNKELVLAEKELLFRSSLYDQYVLRLHCIQSHLLLCL